MIGADHFELPGVTFAAIVLNCECSEHELCTMSATNCFQHKKTCMLKVEEVSLQLVEDGVSGRLQKCKLLAQKG